jgi:hypothetical protein
MESSQPPPGDVMSARRRELFYAAYGSNLSAERFSCYIAGGTAPGSTHTLRGARDPTLPASRPARGVRLRGSLYFAGSARTWGGGAPAFLEPAAAGDQPVAVVLARAWRLGWDQFEDVMAQENGRETSALDIEQDALVEGFSMLAGLGRYDRLICVGTLEGIPMLTFTAPGPRESVRPAAPSIAYLAHIIIGLRETFALNDMAVVDYLGRAPGATPDLVRTALAT